MAKGVVVHTVQSWVVGVHAFADPVIAVLDGVERRA